MKIVLKYILNSIKDRKLRTLVMLLSVVLSTTLLFVSLTVGDSYAEAQRKMARGMTGSATLSVSPDPDTDGAPVWMMPDAIPASRSILHAVGLLQAQALYKEGGYFENFDVVAADLGELAKINNPRLTDGGELTHFNGNQIVLPERFTSKFGIKRGDDFTLWINDEPYEFQVAAIAAYDTLFLRHTRGTNALVPVKTLSLILGAGGGYSKYLIEPAEGVETAALQKELQAVLPKEYHLSRIVDEAQIEADAKQKSLPFFLIGFFSLTMSVFIIYSSYKVIMLERLPVIGTFRSIGATERSVINILLLESLLYGGLGAFIGIPAGFGALKLMLRGLGNSLPQGVEIPMIVGPVNILLACLAAMAVSVLSALIPVKKAGRLPVKDVVLGTVEEKNMSDFKLLLLGSALLILSILLPRVAQLVGDNILLPAGGVSLAGLLAATIIMIPMLTSGISRPLEGVYGAMIGNTGRLAARNMRYNRSIGQNITLLSVSISAIIVISVVGSFVKVYIGDVFRGAELDGFADAVMSPEFVDEIRRLERIDEVLPVFVLNNTVHGNGAIFGRVEGTENLALYGEMFAMRYEDENRRSAIESAFSAGRNILLSAEAMKSRDIKPGDTIMLSSGSHRFEYTVSGGYKIRATDTEAIIPSACAMSDFGAQNYGILAYTASDPDAVMTQIRDMFGKKSNWSRTVEEFNNDALGTINAFLAPMQSLTWFILALAAVGIINNLLINYIQKRRTAAMYKSVGMSNAQNRIMTLTEAFSSGPLGAVIGIVLARLEIDTIFLVAGPRISMQPELDAGTFLFAGALGIAITLAGSLAPLIKSRQMRLMDELKFN